MFNMISIANAHIEEAMFSDWFAVAIIWMLGAFIAAQAAINWI